LRNAPIRLRAVRFKVGIAQEAELAGAVRKAIRLTP
jgi:hypothetical protein